MSNSEDGLRYLASIASERAAFLGSILEAYAVATATPVDRLAERLHCDEQTLARLRLCRAPREDPAYFADDVQRVAERFKIPIEQLLSIIRDVSVLRAMRGTVTQDGGYLMAARDRDDVDE
jgi:hypothetical protein